MDHFPCVFSLEPLETRGNHAYRRARFVPLPECTWGNATPRPQYMESVDAMMFGTFDFGDQPLSAKRFITGFIAAAFVFLAPQAALAQAEESQVAAQISEEIAAVDGGDAEGPEGESAQGASDYTPLGPDMIKGKPVSYEEDPLGSMTFQKQYSDDGEYALWMHDAILLPIITVISLFVLGLLFYVMVRFNRRANKVPSKTTHNTLIEVIWMGIPALILLGVALPSFRLLQDQFEAPPEGAITIKVTGYQWYWGYEYPDHGDVDVTSIMLDEDVAKQRGLPPQLAVDNRMVVPVDTPLRIQTIAGDVIHAFAVPSLWFKIDAVPGRLNERMLKINEPGIYYGQCSELCGIKHGYMPIAVEAVPREQFDAWILSQGGTLPSDEEEANANANANSGEAAQAGDEEAGNAEVAAAEDAAFAAEGAVE